MASKPNILVIWGDDIGISIVGAVYGRALFMESAKSRGHRPRLQCFFAACRAPASGRPA
jgi:arylsulfatase A-like enzyme